MPRQEAQDLEKSNFIRNRLADADQSDLQKYQSLIMGRTGLGALIHYEAVTGLLGDLPGGLGLVLRRRFYRPLFRAMGRGVIIGRGVVLRYADHIHLGDNVVLDDHCVIDGRGSGEEGVRIEDNAIINRGAIVQSKEGPIRVGARTSIGAGSVIVSMGGVDIGAAVLVAGGCYISGGMYHTERTDIPICDQGVFSRGPVEIGDGGWLGMGATLLDAVRVGRGAVIGAGAVVARDLPDFAVASGVPAELKRTRDRET